MPVDMVLVLSKNKYRRYYKKEQTCSKLVDKLTDKPEIQDSKSACIELINFW